VVRQFDLTDPDNMMENLTSEITENSVTLIYGIVFPLVLILSLINCAIRTSVLRDKMLFSRKRPFATFNISAPILTNTLWLVMIISIFLQTVMVIFNSELISYYYFNFITNSVNVLAFKKVRYMVLEVLSVSFVVSVMIMFSVVFIIKHIHEAMRSNDFVKRNMFLLHKFVIEKGKNIFGSNKHRLPPVFKIFRVNLPIEEESQS
jgi:hypothetical protein